MLNFREKKTFIILRIEIYCEVTMNDNEADNVPVDPSST
jgi:hypothetical protein